MDDGYLFGAMRVFISVADSASFSESARQLGMSQPSVSRQINSLEEYLGVRLLHRTTRKISLTEAGSIYYEKARHIQRDVKEASQSISGYTETPSGLLRVSAPYTWTDSILSPHLSEFLTQYPEIKLDIECNDQFQDIIEDQLDVVIRVGVQKDSSFIAVPFGSIKVIVCATPEYVAQYGKPKTPVDISNHNFILFEDYNEISFSDGEDKYQISLTGTVSANMVSVMISAVKQHIGLTVLPDLIVKRLIDSGELVDVMPGFKIEIKNLPMDEVFALYSNRRHLPSKVRVFLDFFKQKFSES